MKGLRDIRIRALLMALMPLTIIPVAVAVWLATMRIAELESALVDRGETLARQVAGSSEYGVFAENREILQRIADVAGRERGVDAVTILNVEGNALAHAGRPVERPTDPPPDAAKLVARTADESYVFAAPVLLLAGNIDDPFLGSFAETKTATTRAIGLVLIELSGAPLAEGRADVVRLALVLVVVGLLAAIALSAILARSVTRPVMRLAQVVSRIGRGDLTARAPLESAGPLGDLEAGINEMGERLAATRDDLVRRVQDATAELQRQKDEAEQANRVKTQFLAAASHDLRQPLQALGLFVMSLRLETRGGDANTERTIERIEHSLDAVQNVLEALLDISRLDAGIVTPRVERFPLDPLLARVAEQYAAAAERYGLALRYVPTRLWVESDRAMLERIVANLVSNAVRYTERGGVLLGCRRQGDAVRIEVIDTGPGIPPEKQEEAFREFVQLAEAQVSREKGLGLGLAIVQRLCRLLGHELRLTSVVGSGTTFDVVLPRATPDAAAAVTATARIERSLRNRVILVIDDDATIRDALVELLDRFGASTLAASDAESAERLIDEVGLPPDFILSDFRLGRGQDGIGVVRWLRARYGATIPAAILTGDVAPRVLRRVREAGLTLFSKPVRPDDLVAHIAAAAGDARR